MRKLVVARERELDGDAEALVCVRGEGAQRVSARLTQARGGRGVRTLMAMTLIEPTTEQTER